MAAEVIAGIKPDGMSAPLKIGADGTIIYAPAVAATGSLTIGAVADGNTITIDDGAHAAVTFEFDDDELVGEDKVPVSVGLTPAATALNLWAAINAADLDVLASIATGDGAVIELVSAAPGTRGNVAITKIGANITASGMSGGLEELDLRDLYDVLDGLDVTLNPGDINIGNVDVVSMPEITGSVTATPPVVTLTTLSATCASAGSNQIIAAPSAGQRHRIHYLGYQLGATGTQVILVKSGSTEIWNFVGTSIGEGERNSFEPGKELVCGTAEALNFDLTVATLVRYVIRYTTEAA